MAIKIIKLEPGEELDEVLNEVNFLQSCSHKNIVAYGGSFMKKGQLKGEKHIWIAMEFCGGGSVEAVYKGMLSPWVDVAVFLMSWFSDESAVRRARDFSHCSGSSSWSRFFALSLQSTICRPP